MIRYIYLPWYIYIKLNFKGGLYNEKFLSLLIIFFFITLFIPSSVVFAKNLVSFQNDIKKLVITSSINNLTIRGIYGATSIDTTLTSPVNHMDVDTKLTKDNDTAYLSINPKFDKNKLINFVITLPANLDVEIIDKDSNIELYNISGEVEIDDNENDIYIENTGNLSIKDKSGNITINNQNIINSSSLNETLVIEDGSGDINLSNINSSVEIIDSSGNVNISNIKGNADIVHGSGDINVKNVSKKVFIDDGSGDINIHNVGDLIIKDAGTGKLTYDKVNSVTTPQYSPISNAPKGIYIQKDGGKNILLNTTSPIDIEPYSNVIISISNYNNVTFNNHVLKSEMNSLIPNIIRNVGEGASVTINIDNSANVNLTDTLIIGEKNYDINNNIIEQVSSNEPALINSLIVGQVASKSTIKININNSANVTLANNNSLLHIGGGSLIESLINIPSASDAIPTDVKELSININNSSNVNPNEGEKKGKLRIYRGQLINEVLDTSSISNSNINITIDNSSKVSAESLDIIDGELVDEIIDCEDIKYSEIKVKFIDAANVNTLSHIKVEDGELIDEVVDMESNFKSNLNISFLRSSNVSSNLLSVYEGELIDETLDGEVYDNANVNIALSSSSNFNGDQLIIDNGELIDEIVDGEVFNRSQVRISMSNTSNINSDKSKISYGELIDETVDIEDKFDNTTMNITMNSTAKITGSTLEIIYGELIDEIVDSASGIGSGVNVSISDTGNFKETFGALSHVSIYNGELMDEVLDLSESLDMVGSSITIDRSANVIADKVTLNNSELIDEIIDGSHTRGSVLNVTVTNSVNATTASLILLGDSILLSPSNTGSESHSNINYHFGNSGLHKRA